MTVLALRRVDDVVRDYDVLDGDNTIGQIRPRRFGTAELHLGDQRFQLRRDDTAEALQRPAGLVRALLAQVRLRARYSLRDERQVLARAERRFDLSPRGDAVVVHPDAQQDAAWRLACRNGLRRPWSIEAGDAVLGEVRERAGGRVMAWHGPPAERPVLVFALFVLHQQFGTHPSPS